MSAAPLRRREFAIVGLMALGFGLVGIDRFMISTMFPVIAHDLKLPIRYVVVPAMARRKFADPVFLLRRGGSTEDGQTLVQGRNQSYAFFVESALLQPVVRNRDIKGYGRLSSRTVCLTPYDRSGRLLPTDTETRRCTASSDRACVSRCYRRAIARFAQD